MASDTPQRRSQVLQFPIDLTSTRDELNLCEFPLGVLSDRAPDDCLELNFSDQVWDTAAQSHTQRTLKISAPPAYGLPTAKDEEILLALIHLTDQLNQFSSPTVHFTRYELIKLLGWNDGGKSYRRVRDSLARWKSVTLDYHNAWRDSKSKSWVSEVFSIIDNVSIYEAETKPGRTARRDSQMDLPFSSFTWNRVFFESMQRKYFKRLDFRFYQQLKTPTAKRLFRFLDKRFGSGRSRWDFDLRELAFEHIGLARGYDAGQIKAKLQPAIRKLEDSDYLVAMPPAERFSKRGKTWRVTFERASQVIKKKESKGGSLHDLLISRGVSGKAAAELLQEFDEAVIKDQIDVLDWIMREQPDSLANPAGFLVESIRAGFQPPKSYQTVEQKEAAEQRRRQANQQERTVKQQEIDEEQQARRRREQLGIKRAALSVEQLQSLEQQAATQASEADQRVLANPALRQFLLNQLVDQLILEQPEHQSVG